MINIRLVKPSELDNARNFIQSIFPEAMVQVNDDDLVLLAEHGDRVVGFAHVVDGGERIIVRGIGVESAMRGHGVGTLLLDCLLDMIKDDIRPIYLKVRSMNPAIDLYARYGFFLKKFGPTHVLVKRPHN